MKPNLPTIEELLAQVQSQDSQKKRRKIENHTNTNRYIEEMGLTTGTIAVPNYVIFWHYCVKWDGSNMRHKANKIVFFRTFSQKFTSHRVGKQRYYLLNDAIEINDKILEEAKFYDKKYVRFKKDKKTTQGKAEVLGNSPGDETPQG